MSQTVVLAGSLSTSYASTITTHIEIQWCLFLNIEIKFFVMAVTKSAVRGIMCSLMEFTFKASKNTKLNWIVDWLCFIYDIVTYFQVNPPVY